MSSVNSEDMSQLGLDAGIYGGSQKDSMADQHVMSRCKATFSYRGSNVDEVLDACFYSSVLFSAATKNIFASLTVRCLKELHT